MYYVNHGDYTPTGGAFIDRYSTDTIIHDTTYRILNIGLEGYTTYVREDTLMKKVFVRMPISDTDTTEMLMYDYTWKVGDTFKTPYSSHIVISVDSVLINSSWYKIWQLFQFGNITKYNFGQYEVIEGIGCTFGPTYGLIPVAFSETNIYLRCFTNRGVTSPLSHTVSGFFNNSTSCNSTFGVNEKVGINNIVSRNQITTLIPNPIDETSKIILPHNIQSGRIVACNNIGQTIISTTFQNKEEVVIGAKIHTPGMYFYHVIDNRNGEVFTGKFIYR